MCLIHSMRYLTRFDLHLQERKWKWSRDQHQRLLCWCLREFQGLQDNRKVVFQGRSRGYRNSQHWQMEQHWSYRSSNTGTMVCRDNFLCSICCIGCNQIFQIQSYRQIAVLRKAFGILGLIFGNAHTKGTKIQRITVVYRCDWIHLEPFLLWYP